MKKLTKVSKSEFPISETANSVEEYGQLVWNSMFDVFMGVGNKELSPNVGYWIAGDLLEPMKVGEPVKMMRYIRNGVKCEGIFYTTPIEEIFDGGFTTANSVYKLEEYNDSIS
jgi:hypothetical protein